MKIPIPCHKKRFRLIIGFRLTEPVTLIITGKDAEHQHTTYVSRQLTVPPQYFDGASAYREVRIPFPLAPEFLMLEIRDAHKQKEQRFLIERLDVEPMEEREVWEHEDIHAFIPFANWFAEKAGYLPAGIYDSSERNYLIDYREFITTPMGLPMLTPARTSRKSGKIEASRFYFKPLTVPIRWFILMHERKHFQLPTREEKVADLTALRVFLDYGFPKVEAIYACTLAMKAQSPEAKAAKLQRLKDIHGFIANYQETKTAA